MSELRARALATSAIQMATELGKQPTGDELRAWAATYRRVAYLLDKAAKGDPKKPKPPKPLRRGR